MTKQYFSFKEIFMFGWVKTKQHAWFITLTAIIISIIMSAANVQNFGLLLSTVVSLMVALSLASISLSISRDHHFTFGDLFTPLLSPKKVLNFFALTAVLALPVILFVIAFMEAVYARNTFVAILGIIIFFPLAYFSVCFKLYPFVVLEHENSTIPELLRMTYKMTAPHFIQVLIFLLIAAVFNLLVAIILSTIAVSLIYIGLFVTIPITLFAIAHLYNKLKEHSM